MNPAPFVSKADRLGLGLVALLVFWMGVVGLVTGRSPWAPIGTIVLSSLAFAVGRAATRYGPRWIVPAIIMLLGSAVFLRSPTGTMSFLSAPGFLGYANAKAAYFVQAAFATAVLVAGFRSPVVAVLSLPTIAMFGMVPVWARSLGGFVSSLLLIPALIVAFTRRGRRAAMALAAILAMSGIATGLVLANQFATQGRHGRLGRLAELLDDGRAAVWADSYRILREHRGFGVGPGGFDETSPTAIREPGLRWTHNEYLQQGAESGLVGLAILIALTGWLLWRMWIADSARAAVAALAVAALAIHACADYLFHFPLLPAATAALAGSASAGSMGEARGARAA